MTKSKEIQTYTSPMDDYAVGVTHEELILMCHAVHRTSMDMIEEEKNNKQLTDFEKANLLCNGKALEAIHSKLKRIKNPCVV